MTDSSQSESASQAKGDNVFFAKQTLQAMALLVGATIIIAAVGIFYIASQLNEQAISQSRFLVEKAWKMRQDSLRTRIKDNAFWGDAYEHLHVKVDPDWAFVSQNLGPSLYNDFNYEGVFVVDGQGKTRYSVINGQLKNISLPDWLNKDITPLIDAARARADKQYIATETIDIAGQPGIVAAAALTTGGDPRVKSVAGLPSVLVFIDLLTPTELNTLGEDYGIHQLRTPQDKKDAASGPSVLLSASDNSALTLHWDQNILRRATAQHTTPTPDAGGVDSWTGRLVSIAAGDVRGAGRG